MNCCYIFGALDCNNINLNIDDTDMVIAADRGLVTLNKFNIIPDYIVGDFDSLDYIPEGSNVIKHPVMKNETDTILAIDIGWEKGFRQFTIYGCLGGRLDHTYANIQTAAYVADKGGLAIFRDGSLNVTVIKDSSINFSKECEGNISVFAHSGNACGVTEKGLLYELINADLSPDYPLGVSNEFIGIDATVTVKNGALCIIWDTKDGTWSTGGLNE